MPFRVAILGNLANSGALLAQSLRPHAHVTGIAPYAPFFERDEVDVALNRRAGGASSWPRRMAEIVCESWPMLRADVIVSLTAILSSREFYHGFVRHNWRPYVAYATGSDLRDFAREPSAVGARAREYFRKAQFTIVTNFDLFTLDAISALALDRLHFYRFPVVSLQQTAAPSRDQDELVRRVAEFRMAHAFVAYLPATIDFIRAKSDPTYRMSKGNDVAFEAFLRLAATHRFGLVVREEGPDLAKAKEMLRPIADSVLFLPTVTRGMFRDIAGHCDVVVDQFGLGTFGGIALEAGWLGIPVITWLNHRINEFYTSPTPYLSGRTGAEVARHLSALMSMSAEARKALGRRMSDWVHREHGLEQAQALVERIVGIARASSTRRRHPGPPFPRQIAGM